MSQYKNIVLATDFSKGSNDAAAKAVGLAQQIGADLTVLHVISYVPPAYVGIEMPTEYSSKDFLKARAVEHLEEWKKENGLGDCNHAVKFGPARRTVVESATELGADLIVVGANGESGFARLSGSVANAVSRHAECDVLVVRPTS